MVERVLILSDMHLGRRGFARSAAALRPLWRGCDRLVVNGDLADIHHPRYGSDAAEQTLALFDLCEQDGVALTLLSGNHDPFISDRRVLRLAGGAVFITHGDALYPGVSPWSPHSARMREAHDDALAELAPHKRDDLQAKLLAAREAAAAEIAALQHEEEKSSMLALMLRPWKVAQVLWYWARFPALADQFAQQHAPESRFAIFGHTHFSGVWRRRDRVIINTGSYGFPGRPRAVIIEDARRLTVHSVQYRSGSYSLGRGGVAEFSLDASH